MRSVLIATMWKRIKVIPKLLKDRSVAFWKKALVVFGIVYLVLPVDLIPPIVPVFGAFDDIVLWAFILSYLKEDLDRYTIPQEGGNGAARYSGRDVVDVDYTVEDKGKDRENDQSEH